jgi:hypothetical protein
MGSRLRSPLLRQHVVISSVVIHRFLGLEQYDKPADSMQSFILTIKNVEETDPKKPALKPEEKQSTIQ